jgi:hypothetical protein
MTAEERALAGALRDLVDEPVLPSTLAGRVETAYARRRRRRAFGTVAATVAAVAAIVVAASSMGHTGSARPPAASLPPGAQRVAASGRVLAKPGHPVVFCQFRFMYADQQFHDGPDCFGGVTVVGVRLGLSDLAEWDKNDGGTIWGHAWLRGVYRDGVLTVEEQGPPREIFPVAPAYVADVPCAAPAGGWPTFPRSKLDPVYESPDMQPVIGYQHHHPDEIVHRKYAWPAENRPVVVLTVLHPAVVERALRPAFGKSLCVVRARWSAAELRRATREAHAYEARHRGTSVGEGASGPDAQPVVGLRVDVVTPDLVALTDRFPDGMFDVWSWLR